MHRHFRSRLMTGVALTACALMGHAATNPAAPHDDASTAKTIVATVQKEPLTLEQLLARNQEAFESLQKERDLRLHQLEIDYGRSYHELLQKKLDNYLDKRAIELEAAERGVSTSAVVSDVKIPAVTPDEVHAFYEARKDQIGQPLESVAKQISEHLENEHSAAAMRAYYDELRSKHHVTALLEPYRVAVDATGPARGKSVAPITIVEFGDFQCPYCQQAEASLQAVIGNHPDEVRLVFRHMPLADLHPNAVVAAQAAICADRQGKFWEMHDAMFGDQQALGAEALKGTAARLGLDKEQFASCLDDSEGTGRVLKADVQAAAELGVNSTPYFFIDGRPLRGTVSPDQFEKIITDEISREQRKADQRS